jgi:hypothetical protein
MSVDLGAFSSRFHQDGATRESRRPWGNTGLLKVPTYEEFANRFAGLSFNGGLYRVHDDTSGPHGLDSLRGCFPDFASRAIPFAFDWLGRQFAVDRGRTEQGEPLVMVFDPGAGQALEIPFGLAAFHLELDTLREPALAESFFLEWARMKPGHAADPVLTLRGLSDPAVPRRPGCSRQPGVKRYGCLLAHVCSAPSGDSSRASRHNNSPSSTGPFQ